MNLPSQAPLIFALAFAAVGAHCMSPREIVHPRTPDPVADRAGPDYAEFDYEASDDYRAAKILRDVRFEGEQGYEDPYRGGFSSIRSSFRFDAESNGLSLWIHGDNRRGKIIDIVRGNHDSLKGEYWIETWKPMAYPGFESGPSRVEFRTFQLKWKVRKVKTAEYTGPVLYLRVLDEQGRLESGTPVPALKLYILRKVDRFY